jgi:hypothetical protein
MRTVNGQIALREDPILQTWDILRRNSSSTFSAIFLHINGRKNIYLFKYSGWRGIEKTA